jgi:hypothetical protein
MVQEINVTNEKFRGKIHSEDSFQVPPRIFERKQQYRWTSREDIWTDNGEMRLDTEPNGGFGFITRDDWVVRRFNPAGVENWRDYAHFGGISSRGLDANTDHIATNHGGQIQVLDIDTFTKVMFRRTDNANVDRDIYLTQDDIVYASDTEVTAYDLNGEEQFRRNVDDGTAYALAVDESTGDYFVGTDSNTVSRYNTDGERLWNVTFFSGTVRALAYDEANDELYAGADDKNIYRLDPSDGSEIWRAYQDAATNSPGNIRAIVINPDGDVFAGGTNGSVHLLEQVDGSFQKYDMRPNNNNSIRDLAADPNNVEQVYVSFNDGDNQLELANVVTPQTVQTYDSDNNREIRGIDTFNDSESNLRIASHTDQNHFKYHDPTTLAVTRSPDIFGDDEPRDIVYIPSEDNYMITRQYAGLEFRDAVTGNLERMYHENGSTQEEISRNIRYEDIYGPAGGNIYIYDRNNNILKLYDIASQSIVDERKYPFDRASDITVKEDSGGSARIFIRADDPHVAAYDGQFNQIYRRLVSRQLRTTFTDGDHDYVVLDNETIQKLDPDTGSILEVDTYRSRLSNIKGEFNDKLLIDTGNDPHLIEKSDLSYFAPFPQRPGYDDNDSPVVDEDNNRILFRLASPRNIFIQEHVFNPENTGERTLYRGKIYARNLHINGRAVQNGISDSRGDNPADQQKNKVTAYLVNGSVYGTNGSYGHIEGVKIDTQNR